MDLVFSFASRISVLVNGALLTEGTAQEVAADARVRAVSSGRVSMRELLVLREVSAGYGDAVVISHIDLHLVEGESLAVSGAMEAGRQLSSTRSWASRGSMGRESARRMRSHRVRPYRRAAAGVGWVPQERNIFKSLTVEERVPSRGLARAVERGGRMYEMFPRLKERRSNLGNQLSGGEQQMLAVARALVLNPKLMLLG